MNTLIECEGQRGGYCIKRRLKTPEGLEFEEMLLAITIVPRDG